MTTPTLEERTKLMASWNAKIAARIEADNEKAAFIKAAGGLASDKTLRDEFAMATLSNHRTQLNGPAATPDDIATVAYGLADAMLGARKATGEGE
jgi:hypothetical protein